MFTNHLLQRVISARERFVFLVLTIKELAVLVWQGASVSVVKYGGLFVLPATQQRSTLYEGKVATLTRKVRRSSGEQHARARVICFGRKAM